MSLQEKGCQEQMSTFQWETMPEGWQAKREINGANSLGSAYLSATAFDCASLICVASVTR